MQQIVTEVTREEYLLDLVLTDVDGTRCKVLPKIAEHSCVFVQLDLKIPRSETREWEVWQFAKADWDSLRNKLQTTDWSEMEASSADAAAVFMTNAILQASDIFIPKRLLRENKSTHPWVNERVMELVRQKHSAEGTNYFHEAQQTGSVGLKDEFKKYVKKEKGNCSKKKGLQKGRSRKEDVF